MYDSVNKCLPALMITLLLGGCGFMAPSGSEGFAALSSPGVFDTDVRMKLSVGPTLLRFAARHMDDEEPELAELLAGLNGVRVRVYEVNGDADKVAAHIGAMGSGLIDEGWQPAVRVNEGAENTQILMKSDGDAILGLVVLTTDAEEVVLVNVMGHMQPEQFSQAMAAIDVDMPGVEALAAADTSNP